MLPCRPVKNDRARERDSFTTARNVWAQHVCAPARRRPVGSVALHTSTVERSGRVTSPPHIVEAGSIILGKGPALRDSRSRRTPHHSHSSISPTCHRPPPRQP